MGGRPALPTVISHPEGLEFITYEFQSCTEVNASPSSSSPIPQTSSTTYPICSEFNRFQRDSPN